MLNSPQNETNLYGNLAPVIGGCGLVPTSTAQTLLPLCNSQIGAAALKQVAKSANYDYCNPAPLKDDSGLTFNNNAPLPLPRKRTRDLCTGTTTVMDNYNSSSNSFPLISVPTGKVSGRCGGVDGGCGFSFLGEDLSLQMMQQQLEVDRLISLHMEKMRMEIEERRRKQSTRIIQAIQEALARKLKERDEQIEKIGNMNWALEERVKSLCIENQIWRDLAQTNEATANALRSNLEQVLSQANNMADERIFSGAGARATDDAESCCGSSGHGCEDNGDEVDGRQILRWRKVARTGTSGERKEVSAAAVEEEERRKRMCRGCGTAESSVLLLPCRHLCLCTACGPSVYTCPICNSIKSASVLVNLS